MKFKPITDTCKVFPGEYLLHLPTNQIVLCGSFRKAEGRIKAMANGRLLEDNIGNFRKILGARKVGKKRRPCGGCKSR